MFSTDEARPPPTLQNERSLRVTFEIPLSVWDFLAGQAKFRGFATVHLYVRSLAEQAAQMPLVTSLTGKKSYFRPIEWEVVQALKVRSRTVAELAQCTTSCADYIPQVVRRLKGRCLIKALETVWTGGRPAERLGLTLAGLELYEKEQGRRDANARAIQVSEEAALKNAALRSRGKEVVQPRAIMGPLEHEIGTPEGNVKQFLIDRAFAIEPPLSEEEMNKLVFDQYWATRSEKAAFEMTWEDILAMLKAGTPSSLKAGPL